MANNRFFKILPLNISMTRQMDMLTVDKSDKHHKRYTTSQNFTFHFSNVCCFVIRRSEQGKKLHKGSFSLKNLQESHFSTENNQSN
ncbi:MAG TPA: hypothetical protein DCQ56_03805 [Porphyromonadaceae bacterium]|jgi:hypothetical protein|nr:hypothetical protein [Porphyromonadaceae bacterium]